MNPSTLADLDREYEAWEEAEAMHAHVMSVHDILDTLDPDRADHAAEWKYQQQRLQHSPTYFSGSMFYRGERLFGSPTAAGKSTQPKRTDDIGWGKWVAVWMLMYSYRMHKEDGVV